VIRSTGSNGYNLNLPLVQHPRLDPAPGGRRSDRSLGVPRIVRGTGAELVRDFVVWVRFHDGSEGEVDLSEKLDGPVFEPVKVPELAAQFA